jgi:NhaP-type Na+/H+ or K+/H+ antiporter
LQAFGGAWPHKIEDRADRAFLLIALLSIPSKHRVSIKRQHVLVWGGLRGALALAAISVIFIVVAFLILVQGLAMTPLLKYLGELHPKTKRKTP